VQTHFLTKVLFSAKVSHNILAAQCEDVIWV